MIRDSICSDRRQTETDTETDCFMIMKQSAYNLQYIIIIKMPANSIEETTITFTKNNLADIDMEYQHNYA